MAVIALSIGVLLALIIALLAVPLTVVFSIHRVKQTQGHVRIHWLFGLVRLQLRFPRAAAAGAGVAQRPKLPVKKKATLPRQSSNQGTASGMFALLQQSSFRRRVYRFLADMFSATHARNLFLRLRIGLGDPAETGWLWTIIGPIAGMAQNFRSAEVRIEPEFMDPLFEIESHGRFSLVPIQFIVLTAGFLLSPTVLRAWRSLHRGNV